MTAREVYLDSHYYRISGEGYAPEAAIEMGERGEKIPLDHDNCFTQACLVALLCNDASLLHEGGEWILHGDPTEGALLTLATKPGLTAQQSNHDWPRADVLPFESEKRYMATLHHNNDGQVRLMVKGAAERLLDYAEYQLESDGLAPIDSAQWQKVADDFAARGMRVMALAIKDYSEKPDVLSHHELESGLTLVGLVGISDPPRPEAIASVKQCHSAGIRVKMITGDNPVTAAAIGKELGLNTSRVLTGKEIDEMDAGMLSDAAEQTEIFARTSPANKLQLVSALQANRHVVAMTGDGVNDAPALPWGRRAPTQPRRQLTLS